MSNSLAESNKFAYTCKLKMQILIIFLYFHFSISDVNECADPDICDTNARCINSAASYDCVCNSGYAGLGDPNTCKGITSSGCHSLLLSLFLFRHYKSKTKTTPSQH